MELRTHSMKTPTANVIAPELDTALCRRNREYAARRADRTLDLPSVRLVMPGVFERWAQDQSKSASARKMPICRSDRRIADQLAQSTKFHQVLPQSFRTTDPHATMPTRQLPDQIG